MNDNTNTPTDLTRVMRTLVRSKPAFITVCGDNYYPLKIEEEKKDKGKKEKDKTEKKEEKSEKKKDKPKKTPKTKLLDQAELISGFNCLPKNVDILMSYGNHDLETGLTTNGSVEDTCQLTLMEKAAAASKGNIRLELFQSRWFNNHTLIIMLDTSLYDVKDEDTNKLERCYAVVDPTYDTIDKLHDAQMEFVRSLSGDIARAKNVVIIGHHPLAYLKFKDEDLRKEILHKRMFDLLLSIKECSKAGATFYYLCADYHQYTSGTVTIDSNMAIDNKMMSIKQYVVGTGGANLDTGNLDLYRENMNFDQDVGDHRVEYMMTDSDISDTKMDNGFLVVSETKNTHNLIFKFVVAAKHYGRTVRASRK